VKTGAMGEVLRATGVTFTYEPGGRPEVDRVSFSLGAGRTFGILGGNESGKTTLAQVLLGNLTPQVGALHIFGASHHQSRQRSRLGLLAVRLFLAGCFAIAVCLAALVGWSGLMDVMRAGAWSPVLLLTLVEVAHQARALGLGRKLRRSTSSATQTGRAPTNLLRKGIAYISSEHDAGQSLPANQTIEEAIAQDMPLASRAARRREVLAALEASGFQLYTAESGTPIGNPEQYLADGVKCGELSGGQRHLVYILSVLASRPRLLICDDCLCGLDIDRQSSMLQLLQKLQIKYGMAIVFMTVDLTSMSLMAHEAAFMKHGRFIETGTANDLVEKPQRKDTQVYIKLSEENEERSHGKNLRNAYQQGESVFQL